MTKKKASKPQEKQFLVSLSGNDVQVNNETISDVEMIGILSVLLDAYKERFTKGGGASASENVEPGAKA